jgi:hypothetical protein
VVQEYSLAVPVFFRYRCPWLLYRYFVVLVPTVTETGRFRASYTLALTFHGAGIASWVPKILDNG